MFDFNNIFKNGKEPDFINDSGTKWWKQKLHLDNKKARVLESKNYSRWYVETEDGEQKHLVLKDDKILNYFTGLETLGAFLDILYLSETMK